MKIYWFDISTLIPSEKAAILSLDGFPTSEKERISRLRQESDRLLTALGFLLLKHAGIPILHMERTAFNKPFTKDSNLKFSISHSGNIVLAAISDGIEIGIDIELKNEIKLTDFHYIMRPEEIERIQTTDAFYKLWASKEAVIKALGLGFQQDVKEMSLFEQTCTLKGKTWYLCDLSIAPAYQCTLASETMIRTPEVQQITCSDLNIKMQSLTK